MKKYPEYDINNVIAELNRLYEQEVVKGFIDNARYDLLLGYAVTNKGAVIENGHIKFLKEDNFSKRGDLRFYTDPTTEQMSKIYERKRLDTVCPNRDWQKEALQYVSAEYLKKFKAVEDKLLSKGKLWDLVAFAEHVPHANLELIEERLVKEGSSLQLLAYAMDVKFSDKDKIRKALHAICERDQAAESRVDFETKQLHFEHYMQFKNLFGSGKKETERE